jgi:hypothetical protein
MVRAFGSLLLLACLWITGCSNQPALIEISGTVTFKGSPIPAGDVSFMPDVTVAGGQLRMYMVKEGKFDSVQTPGMGLLPGKYKVRVNGYDGKQIPRYFSGKQIFNPYELEMEIATGISVSQDFVVPEALGENIKYTETADF